MLKIIFFVVALAIGYIAYTGIDVSREYDATSNVRNTALSEIVDPITKKILKHVSESDLDQVIEKSIENYSQGDKQQ